MKLKVINENESFSNYQGKPDNKGYRKWKI